MPHIDMLWGLGHNVKLSNSSKVRIFFAIYQPKINYELDNIGKVKQVSEDIELVTWFSAQRRLPNNENLLESDFRREQLLIQFSFRFTKYRYDPAGCIFIPVEFNYTGDLMSTKQAKYATYTHIHETFKEGVSDGYHYDFLFEQFGQ